MSQAATLNSKPARSKLARGIDVRVCQIAPGFWPRDRSQRLGNGRAILWVDSRGLATILNPFQTIFADLGPGRQMSAVEAGQTSAVETGQMSAVETGQMPAVETRQMSSAET